jgi:hypothetical protein
MGNSLSALQLVKLSGLMFQVHPQSQYDCGFGPGITAADASIRRWW